VLSFPNKVGIVVLKLCSQHIDVASGRRRADLGSEKPSRNYLVVAVVVVAIVVIAVLLIVRVTVGTAPSRCGRTLTIRSSGVSSP
jgi:hypothetical protein